MSSRGDAVLPLTAAQREIWLAEQRTERVLPVASHDVTARHDRMTQPGSLAQIGPVLAARITEIERHLPHDTNGSHSQEDPS